MEKSNNKKMNKLNIQKIFSIQNFKHIKDHKFEICLNLTFGKKNDLEISFIFDVLNETIDDLINDIKNEINKQLIGFHNELNNLINIISYKKINKKNIIKTEKRKFLVCNEKNVCICDDNDCPRNK